MDLFDNDEQRQIQETIRELEEDDGYGHGVKAYGRI